MVCAAWEGNTNPTLRSMGGHDTGWRLAGLALAWIAGVALQLTEPALMPAARYLAALTAGALLLAAAWRWGRAFMLGVIGMALLGFGSAGWRADGLLSQRLAPSLEGQDIVVTGVV